MVKYETDQLKQTIIDAKSTAVMQRINARLRAKRYKEKNRTLKKM